MQSKLLLYNPSEFARGGPVTAPWAPIERWLGEAGIHHHRMEITDQSGRRVPFQIDRPVPHDRSRDTFCVYVDHFAPSHRDNYSDSTGSLTVDSHAPEHDTAGTEKAATASSSAGGSAPLGSAQSPSSDSDETSVITVGDEGKEEQVALKNGCLEVYFNLTPAPKSTVAPTPEGKVGSWYAGSATSAQLTGNKIKEILDPGEDIWKHDPEKRCMQVDFVEVSYPGWADPSSRRWSLYDQPYELIAKSAGPVRASATVRVPFDYDYYDPYSGRKRNLRCSLYRILTLYTAADYLLEEIFVSAPLEDNPELKEPANLYFELQMFTALGFSKPYLSQFEGIPDWFVVSNLARPFVSYGFATDVHVESILDLCSKYPFNERNTHARSWRMPRSKRMNCLHQFGCFDPAEDPRSGEGWVLYETRKSGEARSHFERKAGHAWYEHIFRPLRIGGF